MYLSTPTLLQWRAVRTQHNSYRLSFLRLSFIVYRYSCLVRNVRDCVCLFLYSLSNFSNDVRWSLDLRWQKTGTPIGLWGLKDGVAMRGADGQNLDIDWNKFNSADRNELQMKSVGAQVSIYLFCLFVESAFMSSVDPYD